jgi:hypothetical protein
MPESSISANRRPPAASRTEDRVAVKKSGCRHRSSQIRQIIVMGNDRHVLLITSPAPSMARRVPSALISDEQDRGGRRPGQHLRVD